VLARMIHQGSFAARASVCSGQLARRCRRRCWRASCLDTPKGIHRGEAAQAGRLNRRKEGRCCWMKVGEMPLHLQPKLLRVFAGTRAARLGETGISGGHSRGGDNERSLAGWCGRGCFVQICITGLNVIALTLPPLRERREDIPCWRTLFGTLRAGTGVAAGGGVFREALRA